MIIFLILLNLFFAALGCVMNYVGVSSIIEAFGFSGGSAIGLFCGGIAITILGIAIFVLYTMIGRLLLDAIKEYINDRT